MVEVNLFQKSSVFFNICKKYDMKIFQKKIWRTGKQNDLYGIIIFIFYGIIIPFRNTEGCNINEASDKQTHEAH